MSGHYHARIPWTTIVARDGDIRDVIDNLGRSVGLCVGAIGRGMLDNLTAEKIVEKYLDQFSEVNALYEIVHDKTTEVLASRPAGYQDKAYQLVLETRQWARAGWNLCFDADDFSTVADSAANTKTAMEMASPWIEKGQQLLDEFDVLFDVPIDPDQQRDRFLAKLCDLKDDLQDAIDEFDDVNGFIIDDDDEDTAVDGSEFIFEQCEEFGITLPNNLSPQEAIEWWENDRRLPWNHFPEQSKVSKELYNSGLVAYPLLLSIEAIAQRLDNLNARCQQCGISKAVAEIKWQRYRRNNVDHLVLRIVFTEPPPFTFRKWTRSYRDWALNQTHTPINIPWVINREETGQHSQKMVQVNHPSNGSPANNNTKLHKPAPGAMDSVDGILETIRDHLSGWQLIIERRIDDELAKGPWLAWDPEKDVADAIEDELAEADENTNVPVETSNGNGKPQDHARPENLSAPMPKREAARALRCKDRKEFELLASDVKASLGAPLYVHCKKVDGSAHPQRIRVNKDALTDDQLNDLEAWEDERRKGKLSRTGANRAKPALRRQLPS